MPPTRSSTAADQRRRRVALLALGPVIVVVVGALLVFSLRSVNHGGSKEDPPGATIAGKAVVGQSAPLFTATGLDGRSVSLGSLLGRPVIVSFGASWCHPCRQEYPLLVAAAAKYSSRLRVVSVMHDDLAGDARNFMREFHARWPAVNDESNRISQAYGVVGVPQTFFITPGGVVQARVFGITSHRALDGPLNHLLATR